MKRNLAIAVMIVFSVISYAQTNLVPNPGFEEVNHPDTCIFYDQAFYDYGSYRHQVAQWFSPVYGSTPFYFTNCDTTNTYSVPTNAGGFQVDGNGGGAYVLLNTWNEIIFPGQHGCIMVRLNKEMKKNHHYLFRMKASPWDNIQIRTNIGICLEKDSAYDSWGNHFVPTYPEYTYLGDSILWDCRIWYDVEFNILPSIDSLKYLVIGTFPTVSPVLHRFLNVGEPCYPGDGDSLGGSMLVDYVRLYDLDSNVGINEVDAVLQNILISPNPAHDKVTIQTANFIKSYNWNLYDMQGRFIQSYAITRKEQEITLPENMAAGMYYWRADRSGSLLQFGKLLKE